MADTTDTELPTMTPQEVFAERANVGFRVDEKISPEDALKEAQLLRAKRLAEADRAMQQDIERRVRLLREKLDALPADDTSLSTVRQRRNINFLLAYYAEGGKPPSLSAGDFNIQDGAFITVDPLNYKLFDPDNPILCEIAYGHHQYSGHVTATVGDVL
ncbi:hypothetical protein SCUCBS95973_008370 [Sporothrix curviconia]|uniref:Kinetochore protein Spc24 n=1 Tax=Sporothrix curviconia TaxID=1260050 RepID=A0ABP0CL28_9PEZI